MVLFLFLFIIVSVSFSVSDRIPKCSKKNEEDILQLCIKESAAACAVCVPRPWPVQVTPIMSDAQVLHIDDDEKTVTMYVKLTLTWKNSAVSVTKYVKRTF